MISCKVYRLWRGLKNLPEETQQILKAHRASCALCAKLEKEEEHIVDELCVIMARKPNLEKELD